MANRLFTNMDNRALTKQERQYLQHHMSMHLLARVDWQAVIEENDPAFWRVVLSNLFDGGDTDIGDEMFGEEDEEEAGEERERPWYDEFAALPGETPEEHIARIDVTDSDEDDMDYEEVEDDHEEDMDDEAEEEEEVGGGGGAEDEDSIYIDIE